MRSPSATAVAVLFALLGFATTDGCGGVVSTSDASFAPPDAGDAEIGDALADAGDAACSGDGGCSVQVSAGRNMGCALRSDGSVWCWGASQFAGLGTMPTQADTFNWFRGEHYRPFAKVVSGVANVTRIAVGAELACALVATGEVRCWGANGSAALGHDPTNDPICSLDDGGMAQGCEPSPTSPIGLPSDVVDVAAGDDVVCALTSNGHVYCWGSNESGVAGQDTASTLVVGAHEISPSGLTGHATAIAIAHDAHAACALHEDTSIWCWGDDLHGHLGRSFGTLDACDGGCTSTPVPVLESDGGVTKGALRIAVGSTSACAQTASNVRCWGGNSFGDLAIGSTDVVDHPSPRTSNVPSGSRALAGASDAYFVHDALGHALVWGLNTHGELGVGDLDGGGASNGCGGWWPGGSCWASPRPSPTLDPMSIAVGWHSVLGVDSEGHVWAWGENSLGQLGHDANTKGDIYGCALGEWPQSICNPVPIRVSGLP